eukprot:GHVN01026163.1.p1 GENE.GHVN01026163.1~~GHVN01026163.1.p1  ORF type:complete len:1083 (+),score=251.64 GHVN01026163.1:207-3251(+)
MVTQWQKESTDIMHWPRLDVQNAVANAHANVRLKNEISTLPQYLLYVHGYHLLNSLLDPIKDSEDQLSPTAASPQSFTYELTMEEEKDGLVAEEGHRNVDVKIAKEEYQRLAGNGAPFAKHKQRKFKPLSDGVLLTARPADEQLQNRISQFTDMIRNSYQFDFSYVRSFPTDPDQSLHSPQSPRLLHSPHSSLPIVPSGVVCMLCGKRDTGKVVGVEVSDDTVISEDITVSTFKEQRPLSLTESSERGRRREGGHRGMLFFEMRCGYRLCESNKLGIEGIKQLEHLKKHRLDYKFVDRGIEESLRARIRVSVETVQRKKQKNKQNEENEQKEPFKAVMDMDTGHITEKEVQEGQEELATVKKETWEKIKESTQTGKTKIVFLGSLVNHIPTVFRGVIWDVIGFCSKPRCSVVEFLLRGRVAVPYDQPYSPHSPPSPASLYSPHSPHSLPQPQQPHSLQQSHSLLQPHPLQQPLSLQPPHSLQPAHTLQPPNSLKPPHSLQPPHSPRRLYSPHVHKGDHSTLDEKQLAIVTRITSPASPPSLTSPTSTNSSTSLASHTSSKMSPLRVHLITGPPGTGKTSVAAHIINTWMADESDNSPVYVGAGTHAAVNAICEKLTAIGCPHMKLANLANTRPDENPISPIVVGTVYQTGFALGKLRKLGHPLCFERVLLDEACQMHDFNALGCISHGCRELVVVGDPAQLTPVKLNRELGGRTLYEITIHSADPLLIDTPYRLPRSVADIVNKHFYAGFMRTTSLSDLHPSPITFVDTAKENLDTGVYDSKTGSRPGVSGFLYKNRGEQTEKGSRYNPFEAVLTVKKIMKLVLEEGVKPSEIGVICLYKKQAWLVRLLLTEPKQQNQYHDMTSSLRSTPIPLRSYLNSLWTSLALRKLREHCEFTDLTVDTVDGYQGHERDYIILNTTVSRLAQPTQGSVNDSFFADRNRVNVALTRCRKAVIIFGDKQFLGATSLLWKGVIKDIEQSEEKAKVVRVRSEGARQVIEGSKVGWVSRVRKVGVR